MISWAIICLVFLSVRIINFLVLEQVTMLAQENGKFLEIFAFMPILGEIFFLSLVAILISMLLAELGKILFAEQGIK